MEGPRQRGIAATGDTLVDGSLHLPVAAPVDVRSLGEDVHGDRIPSESVSKNVAGVIVTGSETSGILFYS